MEWDMRTIRFVFILCVGLVFPCLLNAADGPLLKSRFLDEKKDDVLLTDVTGDGKPYILEAWWNGKRCGWFDENGDMKDTDRLREGLTDAELEELAVASSTWQKYHNGSWLKEKLFRKLYNRFADDSKKQQLLKRCYFTGDFEAMHDLILAQ